MSFLLLPAQQHQQWLPVLLDSYAVSARALRIEWRCVLFSSHPPSSSSYSCSSSTPYPSHTMVDIAGSGFSITQKAFVQLNGSQVGHGIVDVFGTEVSPSTVFVDWDLSRTFLPTSCIPLCIIAICIAWIYIAPIINCILASSLEWQKFPDRYAYKRTTQTAMLTNEINKYKDWN